MYSSDGSETTVQAINEVLNEDERMALTNHWEDGLEPLIKKVTEGLVGAIKDTGFGGKAISHEQYLEYNGIIKGVHLFSLTLSGEVENFVKELNDGQKE